MINLPIYFYLIIGLVSFCTEVHGNTNRNQHFLGANMAIHANAITQLNLPVNALKGSKLSADNGMEINFKNKGHIKIHTMTQETTQLTPKQLITLPLYVMGLQKVEKTSEKNRALTEQVAKTKQFYQPIKVASFRTPNGDGYLLIGSKNSVIYLTDHTSQEMITQIHISAMSEADINNLIIRGLI